MMFSVDNLPQSDDTCHRDTTLSSGTLNIQSEQFSHQNQEKIHFLCVSSCLLFGNIDVVFMRLCTSSDEKVFLESKFLKNKPVAFLTLLMCPSPLFCPGLLSVCLGVGDDKCIHSSAGLLNWCLSSFCELGGFSCYTFQIYDLSGDGLDVHFPKGPG